MQRFWIYNFVFLFVLGFCACSSSYKKDKEGYTKWAEKENGALRKTKVLNDIAYSMQFITCEYQAIKNAKLFSNVSDSVIKTNINECRSTKGQYSFILSISPADKKTDLILAKSKSEDEAMMIKEYFQFGIGDDLKMSTDYGDIACSMVYYEDMYGLSPNHTFNILFDCNKIINHKIKVSFYDRIFGGGLINFSFDLNEIEKTKLLI